MKKLTLVLVFLCLFYQFASAQKGNNLSFSYEIGRLDNDFYIGGTVTSPYFIYNAVAVRAGGGLVFRPGVPDGQSSEEWYTYALGKVGLVGANLINEFIRAYGEGGLLFVFPNQEFSSTEFQFGGYGLWGFEFFMSGITNSWVSYYIELGGIGTGAIADKMTAHPLYLNGFFTQVGIKIYF
ncbi:MAG: hypothetical protein JW822_02875 [Spirochaetales bacterium]|nr:hypothetical protein [Spirochaetales bacterium]